MSEKRRLVFWSVAAVVAIIVIMSGGLIVIGAAPREQLQGQQRGDIGVYSSAAAWEIITVQGESFFVVVVRGGGVSVTKLE